MHIFSNMLIQCVPVNCGLLTVHKHNVLIIIDKAEKVNLIAKSTSSHRYDGEKFLSNYNNLTQI